MLAGLKEEVVSWNQPSWHHGVFPRGVEAFIGCITRERVPEEPQRRLESHFPFGCEDWRNGYKNYPYRCLQI